MIPVDEAELPTVLAVDDDERARELLRVVLVAEGYRVVTAASGPDALEAIRARIPDILLIDLVMPGMDGMEVCRRARQLAGGGKMSIVVLSGMDDAAMRRAALEAGVDAFLTKPFLRSELRDCLARVRRARLSS
jgi:CheY-like chemotaxis protein